MFFSYFESESETRPRVVTKIKCNYPNIDMIMKDLNNKWDEKNIPLKIVEIAGKVMISHTKSSSIGSLAQLKLSPNLAYMIGYTSNVEKNGQHFRFDQHSEFLAPHEAKLFMNYSSSSCESEYKRELEKLQEHVTKLKKEKLVLMAKFEAIHQLEMERIVEKWKSYARKKLQQLKISWY